MGIPGTASPTTSGKGTLTLAASGSETTGETVSVTAELEDLITLMDGVAAEWDRYSRQRDMASKLRSMTINEIADVILDQEDRIAELQEKDWAGPSPRLEAQQ